MKSTGKLLLGLEKFLNFTISVGLNTVNGDLNWYKTAVALFGAAYAAPNKGTAILYQLYNAIFSIISF